ncbi:hypothetical protein L6164_026266 [Bauhinia variegata]|uniref:Uncharacterized protein n=1 Tax=Bauhinia variegata TaxID=167791 RepID=A0ACB9LPM1_BAUVA|nr:hypothetical protein L6164_026266 [Bauhinia variegata]
MEDSFANWDVNDPMDQQQSSASVSELNNLPLLATLVVHIPDDRMLPKVLTFERLQKYKILTGNVWDWSSETETSRILKLWLSTSIHSRDDIKRLLDTFEELHIGKLEGAKNLLPSLNNEGLPQLQHLCVIDNDEIQCVINSLEVIHSIDLFPNLESIVVQNVMNLEKLCSGPFTGESFSKLKIIKVKNCVNLRSLLSASIARSLPQLVEIELEECFHMERVVYDDEKATGILQFPKLCSLTIQSLPQLLGFHYEGNVLGTSNALFREKVMFPSLEKLTINDVDKLNVIWNRLMAEDNNDNFFIRDKVIPNLQELPLDCDDSALVTKMSEHSKSYFSRIKVLNLQFFQEEQMSLSYSFIERISKVEALVVTDISFEKIFPYENLTGDGAEHDNAIRVQYLHLQNLPKLRQICKEGYKIFSKGVPITPKLRKVEVELEDKDWNYGMAKFLQKEFKNLRSVVVDSCEFLSNVVPFNVLKALINLEELEMKNCSNAEVVFLLDGKDIDAKMSY